MNRVDRLYVPKKLKVQREHANKLSGSNAGMQIVNLASAPKP